jgi:hypothetical protein
VTEPRPDLGPLVRLLARLAVEEYRRELDEKPAPDARVGVERDRGETAHAGADLR